MGSLGRRQKQIKTLVSVIAGPRTQNKLEAGRSADARPVVAQRFPIEILAAALDLCVAPFGFPMVCDRITRHAGQTPQMALGLFDYKSPTYKSSDLSQECLIVK